MENRSRASVDSQEKNQSSAVNAESEKTGHKLLEEAVGKASQADSSAKAAAFREPIVTAPSYVPPYVLEALAKLHPDHGAYARTLAHTPEKEQPTFLPHGSTEMHGAREVHDAKDQPDSPGPLVRSEGEPNSGNQAVDKVYDLSGTVRDFYKEVLNRDSIDGNGMKMISTVNFRQDPDQAYENAFWNGSQMTYGRPDADSKINTFLILDVAGHEITHGVTEFESHMKYYGQSGALNESLSDVFGESIKQWTKHQTADDASWVTGEGFWKPGLNARGLRDLLNPGNAFDDPQIGKDPQPANMDKYSVQSSDCGGVHRNSGIPNSAFAHFAKAVGGNSWEAPLHIWYEARRAAGSEPSFAEFAFHTVDEAQKMGRQDLVAKLQKAWSDVGVTPQEHAPDKLSPPPPPFGCG